MKILYIANIRMPTEKAHGIQIMKACEAFVTQGHELTLFVPRRKTSIHESPFVYYGIKSEFPIKRIVTLDIVSWGAFCFIIQSIFFAICVRVSLPKYDVLYGRDEIVLATLALFGVRRIVWESHDGSWNAWARFLSSRMKSLVVVSEGAKQLYIKRGVPKEKILVAPNGIDIDHFKNSETKEVARRRLGLPFDKKIVMYIGRLDGWKGVDTLLDASLLILGDIQFVIIGGEPEQVKNFSVTYPHVTFLGHRPYVELPHNQAAADILIIPNTGKDPILKLFAHMASGRPIIASDLPSIREVAGNDVFFVSPDNPKKLAETIQDVFKNYEEILNVSSRAFLRVQNFSWDMRARKITEFILTV